MFVLQCPDNSLEVGPTDQTRRRTVETDLYKWGLIGLSLKMGLRG